MYVAKKRKIKVDELNRKSRMEKEKINLEREKMKSAEKIQKMKEDGALERERIKSRTAKSNKVVGEK